MIDRKFKTDAWVSYLSQAVNIATRFIFMALVTRYAGIAAFGALTVLTALSNMLANLLTFRSNEAVIAFYRQGEVSGDLARCKFVLVAGVCLDIVAGAVLFLVAYGFSGQIAESLIKDSGFLPEVHLYAGFVFFTFVRGSAIGYLQARERFGTVNILSMLEQIAKTVLVAGWVLAVGELTFRHVVLAVLIPAAICSLLFFAILLVSATRRLRGIGWSPDRRLLGEFVRFNASTFVSSSLKAGNQNIDTVVIGYLADTHVVGLYGLFRQFVSPLGFLSTPLASLTYPKFVQAVVERRHADILGIIESINRKLLRAFLAVIAVSATVFVIYLFWIGIALGVGEWCAFVMIGVATLTSQQMWWARPFANAVDPDISLKGNFYALVFISCFIYPATLWLGIAGAAGVMMLNSVLLKIYMERIVSRTIGWQQE